MNRDTRVTAVIVNGQQYPIRDRAGLERIEREIDASYQQWQAESMSPREYEAMVAHYAQAMQAVR